MAVFSFMETTFVISLGITFLLILLLIYHFKQRLGVAESKQDTMFEIVNNLAQEVTNVKGTLSDLVGASQYPFQNIVNEEHNLPNNELNSSQYQEFLSQMQETEEDNTVTSEDQEETDEESDDDDEDEKIVVSDEEDNISVEELPEDNLVKEEEESDQEKKEEENEEKEEQEEKTESEDKEPVNFSKMNLGNLKNYIVQQGWVSDASKMKKSQILSLIEEHRE